MLEKLLNQILRLLGRLLSHRLPKPLISFAQGVTDKLPQAKQEIVSEARNLNTLRKKAQRVVPRIR